MKLFIIMILVIDLYDFFIYYNDHVMHYGEGRMVTSFGCCLLTILVYLWLKVQAAELSSRSSRFLCRFAFIYVMLYIAVWLFSAAFFIEYRWIRISINIPVFAVLAFGSAMLIREAKSREPQGVSIYKIFITLLLVLNNVTYFSRQSLYIPNHVMDLTIIYLLLINIADILLLYKRDFVCSCQERAAGQNGEVEMWNYVACVFHLTGRELEVLRQVYDGKTNTQIAEALFISERTAKAHVHNLLKKMDAKNRVDALCKVREAVENKPKV